MIHMSNGNYKASIILTTKIVPRSTHLQVSSLGWPRREDMRRRDRKQREETSTEGVLQHADEAIAASPM
jgi:hypothetical protein